MFTGSADQDPAATTASAGAGDLVHELARRGRSRAERTAPDPSRPGRAELELTGRAWPESTGRAWPGAERHRPAIDIDSDIEGRERPQADPQIHPFDADPMVDDQQWMDEAACKGRTTLFFGIAGERPERRARRELAARRMCADCPVMAPCRALARAGRENGFWGGESEEERAAAGFPPRSISRRAVQQASAAPGRGLVTEAS